MKALFIVSTVAVLATSAVSAQSGKSALKHDEKELKTEKSAIKKEVKETRKAMRKLEGSEVGSLTKTAFYSDFGDITVTKWERKPAFDVASFTKDGSAKKAYYDAESKLIGTTTQKSFPDLPASAQKDILKRHPDYKVSEVIQYDDNETNPSDMVLFDTIFEGADNYFVKLTKGSQTLVLKVTTSGEVSIFSKGK